MSISDDFERDERAGAFVPRRFMTNGIVTVEDAVEATKCLREFEKNESGAVARRREAGEHGDYESPFEEYVDANLVRDLREAKNADLALRAFAKGLLQERPEAVVAARKRFSDAFNGAGDAFEVSTLLRGFGLSAVIKADEHEISRGAQETGIKRNDLVLGR